MKKAFLIVTALLAFSLFSNTSFAQTTAPAAPAAGSGDVVASMAGSEYLNATAVLMRVADLSKTLADAGPYTIFAPTNEAIAALPASKVDSLVKDPAKLAAVLKLHIVSGKMTKADIIKALTTGKGKASLKTIDGQTLTLSVNGGKLQLADDKGNTAQVTVFDIPATNGVVHGINGVLGAK